MRLGRCCRWTKDIALNAQFIVVGGVDGCVEMITGVDDFAWWFRIKGCGCTWFDLQKVG